MKRLFVDFHVIQTVPPSCVNRDDTGSPKTAIYGGVTRARVSSQSWKRAMRQVFKENFSEEELGQRTKRIIEMVAEKIQRRDPSKTDVEAQQLAAKALKAAGVQTERKASKKSNKSSQTSDEQKKSPPDDEAEGIEVTKALFFMSTKQADNLAALLLANEDPSKSDVQNVLKKNHGVEIALFGRMVADDPTLNVDAASQVAHAISTHWASNEYDYYTAVDDRKPEDTAGAGMIGTIEFNSATLYRYATVAAHELYFQLAEDSTALAKAVAVFARAFITSMPTGRQKTFANRTLPSAVMVTLRTDQPLNLVDAFEKPIRPDDEGNIIKSSKRLAEHAKKVYKNFDNAPKTTWIIGEELGDLGQECSFDKLWQNIEAELGAAELGASLSSIEA
jgi:CRISPR system Cascade subunit CasC